MAKVEEGVKEGGRGEKVRPSEEVSTYSCHRKEEEGGRERDTCGVGKGRLRAAQGKCEASAQAVHHWLHQSKPGSKL